MVPRNIPQYTIAQHTIKTSVIHLKIQSIKPFYIFLVSTYEFNIGNHQSFPDFSKTIYNQLENRNITLFENKKIIKKILIRKNSFIGYRDKVIIPTLSNLKISVSELINLNTNT